MHNRDLLDLKNKSLEQVKFNEIMKQTNNGNFDKEKVMEVLQTIPNLVELQRTYLNSKKDIINSAKDTQLSAMNKISIKNFERIYEIIERMSKDGSEDLKRECLNKIFELGKLELESEKEKNDTVKYMNNQNNSLWKKIAIGLGAVAITAIGAVAVSKFDKK
ncbi:hypothetical protein N5S72_09560 [Aliarcobacter cryaerophilus]|uniref:hypothetical protein n=1 Tax=Aliarcobacter cryaerophilus TaxID=28198 RepID=UPI0021B2B56D|nr:hypothetical protein [Aliarcobacter cryaerophilus]MCT7464694.1 hypothetical protein [Aliarcobacter cryaerophilus]